MNKITLDEYIKRRRDGAAVYNPQTSQYGRPGGDARSGVRPQSPAQGYMGERMPVYKPTTVQKPYTPKPQTQQTGTGLDATKPTDGAGSNVLNWDDQIDLEIQAAAKKVLEVSNRKFQYNSYESPIYSIMRQEYLKEADLAAGRATAAAAQNAGGFGSSFAVMAGEEARRQVMEGFHDQEDELYAAAQSEFEAERASAFDNYLKLRELKAMEQERLETDAPATMTLPDGTTVEVTDAARELYAGYLESFTQGTGYDTLKTAMINGGASEADADQAIAMFKKLGGATVADQVSALEASPTLSGAQDIMAKAKANGTWDSIKTQVGTKVAQSYVDAINNLDSAYEMLGVDQAAWASLAPEQQKAQIIENAAQRKKDGLIGSAEFNKILLDDVDEMVAAIDAEEITKPATEISNMVITWKNYKDRGYISEKEYNELLNGVTKKIDVAATVKKQAATLGQHASNLAGNVADDLNMSDWWKNFIKGAAKIHVGIVADYNPLSPTFIPSLLSNWKWVRKQLLLNNDQEDAMEELLKAQRGEING